MQEMGGFPYLFSPGHFYSNQRDMMTSFCERIFNCRFSDGIKDWLWKLGRNRERWEVNISIHMFGLGFGVWGAWNISSVLKSS